MTVTTITAWDFHFRQGGLLLHGRAGRPGIRPWFHLQSHCACVRLFVSAGVIGFPGQAIPRSSVRPKHGGSRMRKQKEQLSRSLSTESRHLGLMTVPVVVWYGLFCYLPMFGIAFAFKIFTPKPGQSQARAVSLRLFRSRTFPKLHPPVCRLIRLPRQPSAMCTCN